MTFLNLFIDIITFWNIELLSFTTSTTQDPNPIFCASCRQEGHGRFCSNCGTGIGDKITLSASASPVLHWIQQTKYEALMEYPEVKHTLAHHSMGAKRLAEEELLRHAPKVVTTIYSYDQSFSAMLNAKTGKSDARKFAKP